MAQSLFYTGLAAQALSILFMFVNPRSSIHKPEFTAMPFAFFAGAATARFLGM